MKQLTIISGKGGTGKTTLTSNFAVLAKNNVIADCDVDAADLYLVIKPSITKSTEFHSGKTAVIDTDLCDKCNLCERICRFGAITDFSIDPLACEGCGFCYRICPQKAISMKENLVGQWYISATEYGTLVHAKLKPGEENSGKLVAKVRNEAVSIANQENAGLIIIDGPPGTGCPVISSITGVDAVLIVTEPTVSGIHDLKRIADLSTHFGIKTFICINKWDINPQKTQQIEQFCKETNNPCIGKISFDPIIIDALVKGKPVVDLFQNQIASEITTAWDNLIKQIK